MFSGASQIALEGRVARALRAAERDGVVSDREQQDIDAVRFWLRAINALASGEEPRFPITVPPSYWLDLREYRPAQSARELDMRLLILQGLRDEVLPVADVEGWRHALIDREDVAFRGYRTHVHTLADERELVVLAEDFVADHVAAKVISDIVAWIGGEFPARLCQDLEIWYAGCHSGPGARVALSAAVCRSRLGTDLAGPQRVIREPRRGGSRSASQAELGTRAVIDGPVVRPGRRSRSERESRSG